MLDTQTMLDYLRALEANNNREWFHDNKAWQREATDIFEALVLRLMAAVQAFDGDIPLLDPKTLTFKLQRDTRFSHDKSPYTPAFRAHIGREGKKPIPCNYYVLLRPGDRSFLGGGLFAPMFADATRRVRDAIAQDGAAWDHMLAQIDLPIQGEKLKRVPQGYDPASPQAEMLKHKSWYVEVPVMDALVLAPEEFIQEAAWAFENMKPLNDFLNRALAGFVMPAR